MLDRYGHSRTVRATFGVGMDRSKISALVEVINTRLNRVTAAQLAALPEDPRAFEIYVRIARAVPAEPWTGVPRRGEVDSAVWRAVKRHEPTAITIEPPNRRDSGGPTLGGGPWAAAEIAAAHAMIGYVCSDRLTAEERQILVGRWEDVFGPSA
jgi:hypothetical protein